MVERNLEQTTKPPDVQANTTNIQGTHSTKLTEMTYVHTRLMPHSPAPNSIKQHAMIGSLSVPLAPVVVDHENDELFCVTTRVLFSLCRLLFFCSASLKPAMLHCARLLRQCPSLRRSILAFESRPVCCTQIQHPSGQPPHH